MFTLAWSFLVKFLPNFMDGLLPTNSSPSLNIGFVGRRINKMADKMASLCQFALVDTLSHLSQDFHKISYMNYFYQTDPSSNIHFVQ